MSYTDAEILDFIADYEDHAPVARMVRQLLAQRDEFASLVTEYAAMETPEAMATLANDRDKWFDALTSAQSRISELEMERDEARDEASDMRDEAYIDASAEKPISWQSMHEAECAARHAALADLAAAQSRIHALEEALNEATYIELPFGGFCALSIGNPKFCFYEATIDDAKKRVESARQFHARSTLSPQKEGK
jgi:hypothetical protein